MRKVGVAAYVGCVGGDSFVTNIGAYLNESHTRESGAAHNINIEMAENCATNHAYIFNCLMTYGNEGGYGGHNNYRT